MLEMNIAALDYCCSVVALDAILALQSKDVLGDRPGIQNCQHTEQGDGV